MPRARNSWVVVAAWLLAGCATGQGTGSPLQTGTGATDTATSSPSASPTSAASEEDQIAVAEEFIDAFYSFDADSLQEMLASAEASAPSILGYQAWAEGGHYKVLERHGCVAAGPNLVECPVTVEDDLLLALGSDFKVTDQFNLRFDGAEIVSVETSSDDPELVGEAFEWVFTTHPELLDGACKGFDEGVPENGGDCARAVVAGFEEFAGSDDFPGP